MNIQIIKILLDDSEKIAATMYKIKLEKNEAHFVDLYEF
jgi:hypothetical protein